MSLRKIAKILGVSPAYLSLLLNNKRPWRGDLKERYDELVNTFVNTQTIYKSEKMGGEEIRGNSLSRNYQNYHGGGEGTRTPDLFDAIEALYQLSYTPTRLHIL